MFILSETWTSFFSVPPQANPCLLARPTLANKVRSFTTTFRLTLYCCCCFPCNFVFLLLFSLCKYLFYFWRIYLKMLLTEYNQDLFSLYAYKKYDLLFTMLICKSKIFTKHTLTHFNVLYLKEYVVVKCNYFSKFKWCFDLSSLLKNARHYNCMIYNSIYKTCQYLI